MFAAYLESLQRMLFGTVFVVFLVGVSIRDYHCLTAQELLYKGYPISAETFAMATMKSLLGSKSVSVRRRPVPLK